MKATTTPVISLDVRPGLEQSPLLVRTLGQYAVLREGRPILENGSGGKPLDILMVMIALGKNGLAVKRMEDILWPDSDSPNKTFSINLHRLRGLIGHQALIQKDRHLRLNPELCRVDAWEFEAMLNAAAPNRGNGCGVDWNLMEKALVLYQGDFLAGQPDTIWNIQYRERLRDLYTRAIQRMAKHLEGQKDWAAATSMLTRGLQVDPLCESLYQRLISCHHHAGAHAEVEKAFLKCRRMLFALLGVPPSEETIQLYQALSKRHCNEGPLV